MSRLPRHAMGPQRELFARADIPAHVPRVEHYAAVDRRRVEREHRPVLWEGMASWARHLSSFPEAWQRSQDQDERFRKTARLLDVEKIRICRHDDGLELAEQWLADWRNNDLTSAFTRAQIGTLLVEVRNRRTALALGREQPRDRGPRFDPARIPLEQLDALIQRHPDMAVVEQLRAERNRRLSI